MFERGDAEGSLAAGAALARWCAMDPVSARAAVIAELQRPKPRFGAPFLELLPDQALPEVEAALAQHLIAATDAQTQVNLAELLHPLRDRHRASDGPAVLQSAETVRGG